MKPTVYIETSVISYLTSRPSRDLIAAARQELTRRWWAQAAPLFDLVTSDFAIREAEEQNRATFAILSELRGLAQNEPALSLTNRLVASELFSESARADALHIAIATAHNCDYLLTWKCESIANATRRRRFNSIVVEAGFAVPVICTPPQLHGGVPLRSVPIVEEVWRVREEHTRKYNYDIGAIAELMRERSRSLPGERVMLAPKPFQRRASVRKNADEQEKLKSRAHSCPTSFLWLVQWEPQKTQKTHRSAMDCLSLNNEHRLPNFFKNTDRLISGR